MVVAPNCDVICMDRNGASVATAARVGWERNLRPRTSFAQAILEGVFERISGMACACWKFALCPNLLELLNAEVLAIPGQLRRAL